MVAVEYIRLVGETRQLDHEHTLIDAAAHSSCAHCGAANVTLKLPADATLGFQLLSAQSDLRTFIRMQPHHAAVQACMILLGNCQGSQPAGGHLTIGIAERLVRLHGNTAPPSAMS